MAGNVEKSLEEIQQEESKVPVFTVLKNGAILKNIFVINKPPSSETSFSGAKSMTGGENDENPDHEDEETLLVGRHPHCHIVLLHPSISRFHLQINSKPSSQKLFVTDLSSVHGAWVSDMKIEPGQRVELNEGDTIRVGGSTRVYRLHWIPFSCAYDAGNPFVSASDLEVIDDKDEESAAVEEDNEVKLSQDETLGAAEMKHDEYDSLSVGVKEEERDQDISPPSPGNGETHSLESIVMDIASLYSTDNGSILKKEVALSPLSIIESTSFSYYDVREEVESPSIDDQEESEISSLRTLWGGGISETRSQQCIEDSQRPEYHSMKVVPDSVNSDSLFTATETVSHSTTVVTEKTDTLILLRKGPEPRGGDCPLGIEPVNLFSPIDVSKNGIPQVNKELHGPENSTGNREFRVLLSSECSDHHAVTEIFEEVKKQSSPWSNRGLRRSTRFSSVSVATESANSSFSIGEVIPDIADSKESQTPQSVFNAIENGEILKSSYIMSEEKLNSHNIWARRGKPATPLQLQTSRSRGKTKENEADSDQWRSKEEDAENGSTVKALFHARNLVAMEGEIFTPDKENYTPNTLPLKSSNDKAMLKEVLLSNSCRSLPSNITFSPSCLLEEDTITFSDRENQMSKFQQRKSVRLSPKSQVKLEQEMVLKERRAERVPLQSLFVNPSGKSISGISLFNPVATESRDTTFCTQAAKKISNGFGKRRWTMVADTTSLLDTKSRKSLQLLQGLKGTHLIIPKIVLRELDCLKRQGSLFRRTTQASLAIEWIEESMEKEKWWIHIQSSLEEGRPIAPTPRISPNSQFGEGKTNTDPFSTCWNSFEIASPTAEDHILDYALSQRKINNDGQLVLLTNDVTMTIRAMAEGLLCETAQEFRDSLVNPFSERFMWADSSPRGQTWSVCDDVLLKEKYYQRPSKKSSNGEGAKGLKLILIHNSHYGLPYQSVKTLES